MTHREFVLQSAERQANMVAKRFFQYLNGEIGKDVLDGAIRHGKQAYDRQIVSHWHIVKTGVQS